MTRTQKKITKVCYVLSYRDPEYVRTRVILNLLKRAKSLKLSEAINKNRSVFRYAETLLRLFAVRITKRPDVYILGFRGHEMYWPVRIMTFPKPIIFDEFINMQDWLVVENKKLKEKSLFSKIAREYARSVLNNSKLVLSDTDLGAKSSSSEYSIPIEKYRTLYVAADETVFYPRERQNSDEFRVFFYGNLAPLHGVEHILESASQLKGMSIKFLIVGGKGKDEETRKVKEFIEKRKLTNVIYKEWIDFELLPEVIASADVFIGGPLGNTSQSKRVITGKSFQSLAMGVPTIIGEINEDVGFEDKQNCLLIKQGSSEALSSCIKWAYANKPKLQLIGSNGRDLYASKFSVDSQSENLEKIVTSAVEKG